MANKLVSYYFNLLKVSIKRMIFNFRNFGIKVAIFNFLGEIAYFKPVRGNRLSEYLRKKQRKIVYDAFEKDASNLIDEYKNKKVAIGENCKKIWFMRYEGIQDENVVVKKCFESVKKHSGDYEVVLITADNYSEYANIPQEILDKVNKGTLSLTHLSDITRTSILSRYGGIWVDSTMLFFDNIFNEFDDIAFNSPKVGYTQTCSFFMGGKSNKFFSFLSDFHLQYHLKYDTLIDYFIFDHSILIAYNNFSECKEYIDNSTLIHDNIFYFINHFSDTYVKEDFEEICRKYKYFKISDKPSVNAKLYDKNGNLTNYGYFIKELEF